MSVRRSAGSVVAVGGYRDRAGCERGVVVRRRDAERFEVLDIGVGGEARLVEALAGPQESPATATALARLHRLQQRQ